MMSIIDFGLNMTEEDASFYEIPFEYVQNHVYPLRSRNRREGRRTKWWLHGETYPKMRAALKTVSRYILTPRVSKHRMFAWEDPVTLPDSRLYVFAREDDYFFGVLHSRLHEVWSLATCSWHGDGDDGGRPTYNASTCFETFPFPWAPGKEPQDDPLVRAIAEAAKDLVAKRDAWLNPADATAEELKQRTLTNLYNKRPSWLAEAHRRLDEAVFRAYGWPESMGDAEVLKRLLELNHARAGIAANADSLRE